MKKYILTTLTTLIVVLLWVNTAIAGTWGIGGYYPGGYIANNQAYNMRAYGDSIFIFQGQDWEILDKYSFVTHYYIRYTNDAGATWKYLMEQTRSDSLFGAKMTSKDWEYTNIFFYPPSTVQIVLSSTSTIITSTDWGKTWSHKTLPILKEPNDTSSSGMNGLDTLRQSIGIYSHDKEIRRYSYITYDGWKSYELIQKPDSAYWSNIIMLNDTDLIYPFGRKNFYSSDRGKTWKRSILPYDSKWDTKPGSVYVMGLEIIPDTRTAFISGCYNFPYNGRTCSNNVVWKTSDGGANWTIKLNTQDTTRDGPAWMAYNGAGSGMLLGSKDLVTDTNNLKPLIYITTDSGESWEQTKFADSCNYFSWSYKCAFGSINNAWAYIAPSLYRYDPKGGKVLVEDPYINASLLSSTVELYPNPVKKGRAISIKLADIFTGSIRVQVCSSLGRLIDEYTTDSGSGTIDYIPSESLSAGDYYFIIEALNKRIIKHFVVE